MKKKDRSKRKQEKALRRKRRQKSTRTPLPSGYSDPAALSVMAAEMREDAHFTGLTPVINPPGLEKMSDVMWQFIEPYTGFAEHLAEMERLVVIAAMAWNAAIMSDEDSEQFQQKMITSLPAEARENAKAVIEDLIQRKQRTFADNKRMIVNMKVTDTGDGFHLAVASFMPGDDE